MREWEVTLRVTYDPNDTTAGYRPSEPGDWDWAGIVGMVPCVTNVSLVYDGELVEVG